MRDPLQIVFILDVDKPVPVDELRSRLPRNRENLHELMLSQFEPPKVQRFGVEKSPVDWAGLAEAVVRMVARAREFSSASEAPVEYYIAGHAPLAVFAHLGAELSAWAGSVTVMNRRQDESWAVVPLTRTATSSAERFFDIVPSTSVDIGSGGDGRIAVFVSCGPPPSREAMKAMIREQGEGKGVAQIIEIRTSNPRDLGDSEGCIAGQQLKEIFSSLRGAYPDASGLAVFMSGPAQLAVMIGRALNPTIHSDVWITNFDAGAYELAFALPWRGHRRLIIPQTAEAKLARREILDALNAGFREFCEQFKLEDLPPTSFPLTSEDRKRFVAIVKQMKPLRERGGDDEPFQLEVLQDDLAVSPGLLEALRSLDEVQRVTFGQCLILHELFHISQGLRSATYHGIGRAGFALEEVDYWADAFALGVLSTMQVRNRGPQGIRDVKPIVTTLTGTVLRGLAAFDRFENHGDRIEQLPERRLRRYLIWHLQHARAETLTSPQQIWELFGERLLVELTPLEGGLNAAFDKIARKAVPGRTELFIVLKARLMREPKNQSFDPDVLIDAVRAYDIEALQRQLRVVLTKHEGNLASWRVALPGTRSE
jgi:SMODS-associated and fused to various effectors sensor domain